MQECDRATKAERCVRGADYRRGPGGVKGRCRFVNLELFSSRPRKAGRYRGQLRYVFYAFNPFAALSWNLRQMPITCSGT
jgi:hypothetical protein